MAYILDRPLLIVVITLSLLLPVGCGGGPNEEANDAIAEANDAIAEHNRLFGEARDTYDAAREAIESGEDPEGEAERIAQARETMQEARASLEEAREPLSRVAQNEEVADEIQDYAGTVSEALDAQLAAEARELEFYEVLEEDPILAEDRQRALAILDEVDAGYQEAADAYGRAQEIAEANPEILGEG